MVAVSMQSRLTVTRIESIPSSVNVRHIDELSTRAKEYLYRVVCEDGQIAVDADVKAELARCDVVKFTDYYRISVVEPHASGHVTA
ncbi:hypothetical protein [Natrinema halophilum]|uniref:hypothetical protein n=1 Tax=Natrinema halophilum TaxID=1699371 RepID=UPI001F433B84|nr:hypothetical protein [Natrinema halophilum]UHQ96156.1 hypothetical protein HYG82_22825 [Natrinema halophilum]